MSADLGQETFGRYTVVAAVGRGSTAAVYRAHHVELDRDAAIKVLHDSVRSVPGAIETLRAEARILSRLDHPHIVSLYELVDEPGRTWLAEQWVEGATLDDVLDRHRRLTPEQALGVLTGALSGLAHAHAHDVVHRDVAAANVLADLAGTSMLVDFGLAAPVDAPGDARVVGTPAYLSPEAARGEPVGKPGDVYSAAALAHHLLSGLPVFTGTAWEMVAAHRDRQAPPLTDHGPRLRALLDASLAKDPAVRPPDAAAFLAELEEAARERYGAGWRSRSSIAGLVASTVAAGAAVAGSAAPATVVAEGVGPASSAVRAAVHTGRSTGTKVTLAALAAAVAVGGAAAIAVARGGDETGDAGRTTGAASDDAGDREPSAAELKEQREAERLEELQARVPDGKWSLVSTVVSTDFTDEAVGDTTRTVLTLSPACTTLDDCGGKVKSTSGNSFTFDWTGRSVVITRNGDTTTSERRPCIDTETGAEVPGSSAVATGRSERRITLRATGTDADGAPTRLQGRTTYTVSYSKYVDCQRAKPLKAVYEWVATPR